jgi:hypothetical protein
MLHKDLAFIIQNWGKRDDDRNRRKIQGLFCYHESREAREIDGDIDNNSLCVEKEKIYLEIYCTLQHKVCPKMALFFVHMEEKPEYILVKLFM